MKFVNCKLSLWRTFSKNDLTSCTSNSHKLMAKTTPVSHRYAIWRTEEGLYLTLLALFVCQNPSAIQEQTTIPSWTKHRQSPLVCAPLRCIPLCRMDLQSVSGVHLMLSLHYLSAALQVVNRLHYHLRRAQIYHASYRPIQIFECLPRKNRVCRILHSSRHLLPLPLGLASMHRLLLSRQFQRQHAQIPAGNQTKLLPNVVVVQGNLHSSYGNITVGSAAW